MDETSVCLTIITLLATLLSAALAMHRRADACARRRACGEEAAQALLELLQITQQHRGLSSAMLSGQHDLLRQLPARRQHIARALDTLQALAEAPRTPLEVVSRTAVLEWRQDWNALLADLDRMSPALSVLRHTELIARPIAWLAGVGETMLASTAAERGAQQRLRAALSLMPALSETLGQARALGSGMTASGHSDAVARVRMAYLMQRADSLLGEYEKLAAGGSDIDLTVERQFVQLVKDELIAKTRPALSTGDYFERATRAIDSTFVRMRSQIGAPRTGEGMQKKTRDEQPLKRAA